MAPDLLQGASWECCATAPGAAATPDDLAKLALEWVPATVPGTAASALAAAGVSGVDVDASDWWFRCRVPAAGDGPCTLELAGLATVADVWFAGDHVLHSENMFVAQATQLGAVRRHDELAIRFAALAPLLVDRRPRPRWKTMMANHQALRWFRTTLLGRQPGWTVTPAPVGPWRPVRLRPTGVRLVSRHVVARWESSATEPATGTGTDSASHADPTSGTSTSTGTDTSTSTSTSTSTGIVALALRIAGLDTVPATAVVRVGGGDADAQTETVEGPLTVTVDGGDVVVRGEVCVPGVRPWWPHTHGAQPLYPVSVDLGSLVIDVGRVGFRTVVVDRTDGAFTVVVNGVEVFCRGACWWPPDPVGLAASDAEMRATVELVRQAHMNMVRVPGGTVYEDDRFWDLCDELGVLVWQDCMLGYVDPPADATFEAMVVAELEHVLGRLGGRPALAVVCGGQQIEEQAAFFGLPRQRWRCALVDEVIPAVVGRLLPGVPFVTSSPTGGDMPFEPATGDCHYWGVGSLLRPVDDARRCGIRFMSEGLAFATPPERETVDEVCGGAARAGHDPAWKRAVHHDTGRSWDLEDVRDFYVHEVLGVDPRLVRYQDPERALDLGRAVVAEIVERVFGEWRRPGSPCAGGLVVALRDLAPGAGWGVVDALGRPKAPWFSLRRVLAPVAVILTDEGLNGLRVHVMNDTDRPVAGHVRIELYTRGELRLEEAQRAVDVPARGHVVCDAGSFFEGFRDLSYAYRYGPPAYDVVAVTLCDAAGDAMSEVVHLPAGLDRPVEPDVGLEARARPGADGTWTLSVSTRRLAQWVVVDVPGFRSADSWFHLAPGRTRTLALHRAVGGDAVVRGDAVAGAPPAGRVRALNARSEASLVVEP